MELFRSNGIDRFDRCGTGYLGVNDALKVARGLRTGVADLVFLDPPFNLGKDYGSAKVPESLGRDQYQAYIERVIRECARIIKPGGSLFLYHLPYWASRFCPTLEENLEFRHWIAISMKSGFARGRYLYPAHYALLYFAKGVPTNFSRPVIDPPMCARCKRGLRDYGGYKGIIKQRGGVNLSDVWDDLSPVRHRSSKLRASNQLPVKLTDRVMEIAGTAGGILFDPFVGTGTSLVSAVKRGMAFVGNDLDGRSIEICRQRLASAGGGLRCEQGNRIAV